MQRCHSLRTIIILVLLVDLYITDGYIGGEVKAFLETKIELLFWFFNRKNIPKEIEIWQTSKTWPFSCIGFEANLPSFPGIDHILENVTDIVFNIVFMHYVINSFGKNKGYLS